MHNTDNVINNDPGILEELCMGRLDTLHNLYNKYAPALLGMIMKITGDKTTSEDILQSVFIDLWKNKETYYSTQGVGSCFTLLLKIARQKAASIIVRQNIINEEKNQKTQVSVNSNSCFSTLDAPNSGNAKSSSEAAFELLHYRNNTLEEVSQKLNITPGIVKAMLRIKINNWITVQYD